MCADNCDYFIRIFRSSHDLLELHIKLRSYKACSSIQNVTIIFHLRACTVVHTGISQEKIQFSQVSKKIPVVDSSSTHVYILSDAYKTQNRSNDHNLYDVIYFGEKI
jgi:hypothetical protein